MAWLGGYLVFVFGGGALLAPLVWWAVQSLAQVEGAAWMDALARHPFHRFVHRCLLGLALIGLFPLARALGCRRASDVGLSRERVWLRRWARGVAVGFLMFAACLVFELEMEVRQWRDDQDIGGAVRAISGAALTALVVGLIEEILFRGVLCGGLRRSMGWWPAILVSSAVYSAVHFFQRPPAPEFVTWLSGLETVTQLLRGLVSNERLVQGFFTLFAAGILLALMFRRTGTLYFSMGLHSGWVFWIKFRGWLTAPGLTLGGATTDVVSAWVNFSVIGLTLVVITIVETTRRSGSRVGGEET
jgi:membrane protease YdiL (CAAX protease family)